MAPNLQEQMLIRGDVDISALFTATSYMNLVAIKQDPDKDFRWIYYADAGLDLYSNGVMVSQKLAKEKPEAVKGLVRAINKAIKDCLANPDAAIELLAKQEPLLNKDIEKRRLVYVAKTLIATPEASELGRRRHEGRAHDRCDRDHRGSLRAAEVARGRRCVQPRVPAGEGGARAAEPHQLGGMREITCAHVLTAADRAAVTNHVVRIEGERHLGCRAGGAIRRAVRTSRACQCARPCARDTLQFVRDGRQAAGDLAALAGDAAGRRSVSRDRGFARPLRARRGRQRHGALHARAGPDRLCDGSKGGRARGRGCRRARRLCAGAARSQSAGLWPVGADPRRAAGGGACRN